MKLLSLNAHSWMEIHPSEKLLHLAQAIVAEKVDVVALQEVNQLSTSALQSDAAAPLATPAVGFDNFALLLTQLLETLGQRYRWYWTPAHIGFDRYDEGAAILVREDLTIHETQEIVLADYPYDDVRRRVAQAVRLDCGWIISGHFSWWYRDDCHLFQPEWDALQAFSDAQRIAGHSTIVAGDLNNPASVRQEGYDYIRQHGWIDTYTEATAQYGENTIVEPIAGWEGTTGPRRIDYVLSNAPVTVSSHKVIFDGKHYPVVSDHYGLLVAMVLEPPLQNAN